MHANNDDYYDYYNNDDYYDYYIFIIIIVIRLAPNNQFHSFIY